MRIAYYSETDSLYVYVSERASSETHVLGEGIQADFDCDGNLIGVEIEHVEFDADSVKLNLALANLSSNASTEELPQVSKAFDIILAGHHKQFDPIIQE